MLLRGWVADVHIGNHLRYAGGSECGLNERCRAGLDVLRRASRHALELGCKSFTVAGDLLDKDRPEPQLIAAIQQIILETSPMVWVLLGGNHEKFSDLRGDHALGPFAPAGAVVVDEPAIVGDMVLIPHRNGRATEWIPEAVAQIKKNRKITDVLTSLTVHAGVITDATPKFLLDAPDAIPAAELARLARELGVMSVFAGNWHDRRLRYVTPNGEVLKKKELLAKDDKRGGLRIRPDDVVSVFQLGALVPTGFDNPGVEGYGTLAIFDPDEFGLGVVKWEEIPGPRFVAAKSQALAERAVKRAAELKQTLYLEVEASVAELPRVREYTIEVQALGHVARADAKPSKAEAAEATAETGRALRRASTLEEALANYTANASYQGDPDRAAVLARCAKYLQGVSRAPATSIVVQAVAASGVFTIDTFDVDLPEKGLVLVTGKNGCNKTASFVDAVSVALWDSTGRGTPAWNKSEGAVSVDVVAGRESLHVKRWGTTRSEGLRFEPGGTGIATPTKTQAELVKLVGTFAQWRALHVFCANDDANTRFGRLTDGERKKLVESLIGLDFEGPLKRCRVDVKAAEDGVRAAVLASGRASASLKMAQRSVGDLEDALAELPTDGGKKVDPATVREREATAAAAVIAIRDEMGELHESLGIYRTKLGHAEEKLRVLQWQTCPVCKQQISEQLRAEIEGTAGKAAQAAKDALKALRTLELELHDELGEVDAKLQRYRRQLADIVSKEGEKERCEELLERAELALEHAQEELELAKATEATAQTEFMLLAAVEQTLGLRGVRAVMVGQILGAVEAGANTWIASLGLPGVVRLEMAEKGDIPLVIDGVGGGYGFPACSRGQQARLNLAFIRAFAGLDDDRGTLFFDEPFDGLDSEGRAAAVQLLEDLARERCVVLISHSEELIGALKPLRRYVME